MYSPGVYFARLVDLILENAPISGTRVIESDMSGRAVRNSARRPGLLLG